MSVGYDGCGDSGRFEPNCVVVVRQGLIVTVQSSIHEAAIDVGYTISIVKLKRLTVIVKRFRVPLLLAVNSPPISVDVGCRRIEPDDLTKISERLIIEPQIEVGHATIAEIGCGEGSAP